MSRNRSTVQQRALQLVLGPKFKLRLDLLFSSRGVNKRNRNKVCDISTDRYRYIVRIRYAEPSRAVAERSTWDWIAELVCTCRTAHPETAIDIPQCYVSHDFHGPGRAGLLVKAFGAKGSQTCRNKTWLENNHSHTNICWQSHRIHESSQCLINGEYRTVFRDIRFRLKVWHVVAAAEPLHWEAFCRSNSVPLKQDRDQEIFNRL